jgi:two-component system nitrate/nitrite response regulator NarL
MHPSPTLRISLLQEQALLRDSLARVLDSHGGFMVVGQYADSRRFLTQLELDRPQVAIVDVQGDGSARLPLLRETCQFHPDLQVLALTDNAPPEIIDGCFQAGVSGCVDVRTSQCEAFVEALQAVARGQRVFPGQFFETLLQPRSHQENQVASVLTGLSAREREVLTYLAAGADNLKIASLLRISERTVKAHVSSLYRKLGQENRTQLAGVQGQLGIRPPAEV